MLQRARKYVVPVFLVVKNLVNRAAQLKQLLLCLTYYDQPDKHHGSLAQRRGIRDSGLEPLRQWTTFGICAHCIHYLAGQFIDGNFQDGPASEKMERMFWDNIWNGALADIRAVPEANIQAVQTAVMIGMILSVLEV